MRRFIAICRLAECDHITIDVDWAVKLGLSKNPESARKMFYRYCQYGILKIVKEWHYAFYELTAEFSSRKKNVPLATFAATATTLRQPKLHRSLLSLQNESDYIKSQLPADIKAQVCNFRKHLSRNRRIEDTSRKRLHKDSSADKVEFVTAAELECSDNAAYSRRFPDCCCKGAWICDSCCSTFQVVSAASLVAPAPIVADNVIPAPLRSSGYGILSTADWADDPRAAPVFDALDTLRTADAGSHRLFFKTFNGRAGELAREFDSQLHHNKRLDSDITIHFDGRSVNVHIERYLGGRVLLKPELTDMPILASQISDFKRVLEAALPSELEVGASETWTICATDLNFDLPVQTKHTIFRFTGKFKNTKIHGYVKRIGNERYFRLEAQLDSMVASTDAEFLAKVERVRQISLESVGINVD